MNYRRLGRTNLRVSEVSLGTVELGTEYGIPVQGEVLRPSDAKAERLLNVALDAGVNFIDTASVYGESEAIIGRGLNSRRNEYFLASKAVHLRVEGDNGNTLRERVQASIARSLRLLRTDRIDLFYIHSATLEVIQRGEMLEIIQQAQSAGHVRFIGATTYGEAAAVAVLQDGRYDCLQIAYNILDRESEVSVLPLASERDVGVVIRSVLLKGALTYRYTHLPNELNELKSVIRKIDELRGSETGSLQELAYRYVLAHPVVAAALAGTGRVSELEEVVAFAEKGPLACGLMESIRNISVDPEQLNPGNWPRF